MGNKFKISKISKRFSFSVKIFITPKKNSEKKLTRGCSFQRVLDKVFSFVTQNTKNRKFIFFTKHYN